MTAMGLLKWFGVVVKIRIALESESISSASENLDTMRLR